MVGKWKSAWIFEFCKWPRRLWKHPNTYQCHVISIDDQNWASVHVCCIQNCKKIPILLTTKICVQRLQLLMHWKRMIDKMLLVVGNLTIRIHPKICIIWHRWCKCFSRHTNMCHYGTTSSRCSFHGQGPLYDPLC
jgi:hypothetical protein